MCSVFLGQKQILICPHSFASFPRISFAGKLSFVMVLALGGAVMVAATGGAAAPVVATVATEALAGGVATGAAVAGTAGAVATSTTLATGVGAVVTGASAAAPAAIGAAATGAIGGAAGAAAIGGSATAGAVSTAVGGAVMAGTSAGASAGAAAVASGAAATTGVTTALSVLSGPLGWIGLGAVQPKRECASMARNTGDSTSVLDLCSWDCWRPILHANNGDDDDAAHDEKRLHNTSDEVACSSASFKCLREVLLDGRVCNVRLCTGSSSRWPSFVVTNVWKETFVVAPVELVWPGSQVRLAYHATRSTVSHCK